MQRAFITGATGFIGGRLAELLHERHVPVTALVRSWSRAAGLARLGLTMKLGDIIDPDSLRSAMHGCDVVFHCAVDNRVGGDAHRRSSEDGTANVLRAALVAGVRRVVYLSSVAVHGYDPEPAAATEDAPARHTGDAYCDGKTDAEKIAREFHRGRGLPVVVLRPTIVYGPFGSWTVDTLAAVRERRMVLIDGGQGVCNSLYVDNLIEAMLAAADCADAIGEVFNISDAQPVTWRAFIEAHANALRETHFPLPEMSAAEINAARDRLRRAQRRPSTVARTMALMRNPNVRATLREIPLVDRSVELSKTVARGILPPPMRRWIRRNVLDERQPTIADARSTIVIPSEAEQRIQASRVVFSIEKARRILGYEPTIDFREGMRRTRTWIEWARLSEASAG